jgi:uncharacterized protein
MNLELLLRRTPSWREIAQGVLFQPGDVVEHGEEAEAETFENGNGNGDGGGAGIAPSGADAPSGAAAGDGSLGIGGLKSSG